LLQDRKPCSLKTSSEVLFEGEPPSKTLLKRSDLKCNSLQQDLAMDRIEQSVGLLSGLPRGDITSGTRADKSPTDDRELRQMKKACQDFESIFIYMLLKTMRESLPKREISGQAEGIYVSIGDQELARSIASGRGIGLGNMLFEQLKTRIR